MRRTAAGVILDWTLAALLLLPALVLFVVAWLVASARSLALVPGAAQSLFTIMAHGGYRRDPEPEEEDQ